MIEEKVFRGPLHVQIRQTIDYPDSFSTTMIKKVPGRAEAIRSVAFPYEAMEEAIVNAIYHRGYDVSEPVKVYLYPDRMEITSYPGPVPGIMMEHFLPGASVPAVPKRNRRIGDFLKRLRLAEAHGTGIPKIHRKMSENGSPEPRFTFDPDRTYFTVTLPAHPQYTVIPSLRESAHLWAIGDRKEAISSLETALRLVPSSGALLAQVIEYKAAVEDFSEAEAAFQARQKGLSAVDRHLPYIAMARAYLDRQNPKKAAQILKDAPSPLRISDIIELAILQKRSGNLQVSHGLFASNYDLIKDDAKAIHEYAGVKLKIAAAVRRDSVTRTKLTREAVELLRRAIQLSDDAIRNAWCWFDLAKSLLWLHASESEVLQAYNKAIEILPKEQRFLDWYQDRKDEGKLR